MGINLTALKSLQFWAVLVLTNVAIASASGVVMEGSDAAKIIGWAVAVLSALGFRSWVPAAATEEK